MGPMQLMIRCLNRILSFPAPITYAARANSCCFKVCTWVRTCLAMPIQEETQMPRSTEPMLEPNTIMINITYSMEGME